MFNEGVFTRIETALANIRFSVLLANFHYVDLVKTIAERWCSG
jgi:hypothetical protein